jgi:hypothetical protein
MARRSSTRNPAPLSGVWPLRSRRAFSTGACFSSRGFPTAQGSAQVNTRLAQRRAEAVLDAVRAATDSAEDRVTLRAEAFGEALPMACEDTAWGSAVNRRVEVWVE